MDRTALPIDGERDLITTGLHIFSDEPDWLYYGCCRNSFPTAPFEDVGHNLKFTVKIHFHE